MFRSTICLTILALCAVFAPCAAYAACSMDSGSILFGQYRRGQDFPLRATQSLVVRCPASTTYKIELDEGLYYQSGNRRMKGTKGYLAYQLYSDPGYTKVWTEIYAKGKGNQDTFFLYGAIFPLQSPPVGTYVDVVRLTVTY